MYVPASAGINEQNCVSVFRFQSSIFSPSRQKNKHTTRHQDIVARAKSTSSWDVRVPWNTEFKTPAPWDKFPGWLFSTRGRVQLRSDASMEISRRDIFISLRFRSYVPFSFRIKSSSNFVPGCVLSWFLRLIRIIRYCRVNRRKTVRDIYGRVLLILQGTIVNRTNFLFVKIGKRIGFCLYGRSYLP